MPHPGHTYGLLNRLPPPEPAPRRLGSAGGLPPSLLAAAEEFNRNDSPEMRQYAAHQAAMVRDPNYASIGAAPSRGRRLLDNLRHRLPRMVGDTFGSGMAGTVSGAARVAQALLPGEQPRLAALEGYTRDQIPESGVGILSDIPRAAGLLGSLGSEFTMAGDVADMARVPGHLGRGEWGSAGLSALAAVPAVGTPAAGLLKTRRGVKAGTEAAAAAQAASRAAAEQGMVERVAAQYLPDASTPTIGPEVQGLLGVTEATGTAQEVQRATTDPITVRSNRSREDGWQESHDAYTAAFPKIEGRAYRGMTKAEYDATVGAGRGVRSRGDYSDPSEGTVFAENALDAEDYVNYGRDDPRTTGEATYLVEVDASELGRSPDGYLKTFDRATETPALRVWEMSADGGDVVARPITPDAPPKLTPQQRAAEARAEGRATARQDPDIGPAARRSEKRYLHHTSTPERIAKVEREIERGLAIVPEELAQFQNASPALRAQMVESYLRGPKPENFADTILAGSSGKGWYDISGEGIAESFGDDAPRFTALLAAQSPNKSVKDNLKYALETWARWNEAGRPAELTRESARSLIASPLPADFDNSILALNADAGELLRGELKLSGPKVDPFNLDLMGNVNRIVQDTHQARGYGVAQSRIGNVGVNLPMNAMVRNAARIAGRRVGVDLTSANAQEMGWGWIRGLTNAAGNEKVVAALKASLADPSLPMAGDKGLTLAQRTNDNVALGDLMARPEFLEAMQRAGVTAPQPRSTPGLGVEVPPGAVRPSALLDTAARVQANKMGLPLLGVGGLLGANAAARQRDDELDPNIWWLAPPGRQ